jgi:ribonucleoside-diphosphate reductase alpha chain
MKIEFITKEINIEDAKTDDYVMSYNIKKRQSEFKKIEMTHSPIVNKKHQIAIVVNNDTLITSVWHPTLIFKNNELIYVRADELKIEDLLVNKEGLFIPIEKIYKPRKISENFSDLTVIDNNNYFTRSIGQSSYYVIHNTQGLADTFIKLKIAYDSKEAKELNKLIFETMYHAALSASNDLAKKDGAYETFKGSPASKGILQFDLWNVIPSNMHDWTALKASIVEFGIRNSLVLSIMPTASTASILGNNEACEVITSNIYVRKVLSGEFMIVNKHLVQDLIAENLWSENLKNEIIRSNGSVQTLNIPEWIKKVYKTTWEISQKDVIDMYADRGAFIDQTQSMNLFMAAPNMAKLTSMHFYAWGKRPLMNAKGEQEINANGEKIFYRPQDRRVKTGMYYLRSKPATGSVKFSVQHDKVEQPVAIKQHAEELISLIKQEEEINSFKTPSPLQNINDMEGIQCSLSDPDSCEACSA